ncbi:hypothetical protein [Paraburkholderia sp. HD33-4]|uniref:hypothetical protein n=1 Tax=Paraburkholderia sp. HD33-4 TaxID=2883242 RepID=UPI001F2D5E74|nr:hypothetical protein [Paraburkholderia sp. HD33-4]
MQAETLKKARVVERFLKWTALVLLLLPVAFFLWAAPAYSMQDAVWICFSLAIYIWPVAGVLFVISAGFHYSATHQRPKSGSAGFRPAHGH